MQETSTDKKQEGVISKSGPIAASLLLAGGIVYGAFAFSNDSSIMGATTASTTASNLATVYTNATANVRKCGSITCASVGTYDRGTSIDVSTYDVKDVSQLPDWVSFTYSKPDGTYATGYINKSLLSNSENPVTDTSVQEGDMAANQAQQTSKPSRSTSLPTIIKEWRPSTAYLECYWDYAGTAKWYYKQSGSGLLVSFDSVPTVITNKHVVFNSQYGMPQECDVAFPDDKYVFYSIEMADLPGQPANGQIQFTADGSDVAYLSGFKENKVDPSDVPSSSLQERVKGGNIACAAKPDIGDPLVVIGYPMYGSDIVSVLSTIEVTATEGIISGNSEGYYTTSAKIDHGNSGGLAIDTTNDCYLGIPTAAYTGSIESLGRILPVSYVLQ